jgi:hypothetical protein
MSLLTRAALLTGATDESRPLSKEVALMKRILVLVTVVALMMVMLTMSVAPAFADPDKNDPPMHSCGLNDPNAYKEGGESDEGKPGVSEITQEGFKPLEFGCAPGKEEDPRPPKHQ